MSVWITIASAMAAMAAPAIGHASTFEISRPDAAYAQTRVLRFRYAAVNTSDQIIEGASFSVYAPIKQTATQRLLRLDTTRDARLIAGPMLEFELGRVAPFATVLVTVTALVAVTDEPVATQKPSKHKHPTPDPAVRALAATLKRPTPEATASAIYAWIVDNIRDTGFHARDRGALFALANNKGDCTEMARLFVALCRAANIPARFFGGYVVPSNKLLAPRDFHNWAEFWDGRTWQVADPQKRIFATGPGRFIATKSVAVEGEPLAAEQRFRSSNPDLRVRMLDVR